MGGLPEIVRRLLAEHINSVEQLEVLLLLRDRAERSWTPAQASEQIRSGADSVARRLQDLHKRGFVTREEEGPTYRYAPPPERVAAIDALARAYAERRHQVIELIFAKPIENLRVYSDAFRLRKEPEDG